MKKKISFLLKSPQSLQLRYEHPHSLVNKISLQSDNFLSPSEKKKLDFLVFLVELAL